MYNFSVTEYQYCVLLASELISSYHLNRAVFLSPLLSSSTVLQAQLQLPKLVLGAKSLNCVFGPKMETHDEAASTALIPAQGAENQISGTLSELDVRGHFF